MMSVWKRFLRSLTLPPPTLTMPTPRVRNERARELAMLLNRSTQRLVQMLEEDGPDFLIHKERVLFTNYASDLLALKSPAEFREAECKRLKETRKE